MHTSANCRWYRKIVISKQTSSNAHPSMWSMAVFPPNRNRNPHSNVMWYGLPSKSNILFDGHVPLFRRILWNSFYTILLTTKQTNADENITSSAEIIMHLRSVSSWHILMRRRYCYSGNKIVVKRRPKLSLCDVVVAKQPDRHRCCNWMVRLHARNKTSKFENNDFDAYLPAGINLLSGYVRQRHDVRRSWIPKIYMNDLYYYYYY